MDSKLTKLYYSDLGYWKGNTAIHKLTELSGLPENQVKAFLSKQSICQIHFPGPKHLQRPQFENSKPNDTHQADLLYLPFDTVKRKKYKYALTVIDIASRYKDAEPVTSKSAFEISQALIKIIKEAPLSFQD